MDDEEPAILQLVNLFLKLTFGRPQAASDVCKEGHYGWPWLSVSLLPSLF